MRPGEGAQVEPCLLRAFRATMIMTGNAGKTPLGGVLDGRGHLGEEESSPSRRSS